VAVSRNAAAAAAEITTDDQNTLIHLFLLIMFNVSRTKGSFRINVTVLLSFGAVPLHREKMHKLTRNVINCDDKSISGGKILE
jgi:hypothetical protein